jgi:serine/threonine protein kinase
MISEGLEYLHSFGDGIVHGEFRAVSLHHYFTFKVELIAQQVNILIDNLGHPRIADFGLTQIVVNLSSTSLLRAGGTLNWLSPELVLFDPESDPIHQSFATKESDVYSFGCVCLEVSR